MAAQQQRLPFLNAYRVRSLRYLLLVGLLVTIFAPFLLMIAFDDGRIFVAHQHPHRPPLPSKMLPQQTIVIDTDNNNEEWPPVLTVYLEPDSSYDAWYDGNKKRKVPLPQRNVTKENLTRLRFPKLTYQATSLNICDRIPTLLPIDEFGTTFHDPYLPWIHDIFLSDDNTTVHIIAQNRRRCHKGKAHKLEMDYWEGQVALFQPVAIKRVYQQPKQQLQLGDNNVRSNNNYTVQQYQYRLSTHEEASKDGIETRFICRFKTIIYNSNKNIDQQQHHPTLQIVGETLSTYNFNYEFVNWRKGKLTMIETGKDFGLFWLSPLAFNCPLPLHLQQHYHRRQHQQQQQNPQQDNNFNDNEPKLLVDIIPIRTPARKNDEDGYFFHSGHGGPMTFNATKIWGIDYILPKIEDSGRWENLPVCPQNKPYFSSDARSTSTNSSKNIDDMTETKTTKPYRLVACTWTSAIHQRRGNERRISDGKKRLREWIAFNLQVGFDHMYIFDNTGANASIFRLKDEVDPDFGNHTDNGGEEQFRINDDLSSVTDLFPASKVTRIEWPATICNNNRPAHDDPGERSSQYAAEAACRARYGPSTDWMASMDPDEYFVPMGNYSSWKEILDKVDKEEGRSVLKFRSTRARPLLHMLVPTFDEGAEECTSEKIVKKNNNIQCLTKNESLTYLETYNCEYIKSPKPERFARAMKQLYRPDFVLSHFIHYSTVTADMAREKQYTQGEFIKDRTTNPDVERFMDELNEGVLIHAKTTVPAETFTRDKMCKLNGPSVCLVGIPCPDDLPFNDALHTKNVFKDEHGRYCNCWMNRKVESHWLPKLKEALSKIGGE